MLASEQQVRFLYLLILGESENGSTSNFQVNTFYTKNDTTGNVKNLMYSQKGVVYKLHAGWFMNRTPGEFINWGLFIKGRHRYC